ncbi:MAG: 50S ribosomal protein L5 [Deltaproteobacteria bacterium]|nr:50S ribosomal protein L5 [Deltaproteobacteria bacterium]
MARLFDIYHDEIVDRMMKEFNYQNVMQVPKVKKIVLNMGLGEAIQNIKILDTAVEELTLIAGQRATIRRARRSIAAFKLREGMPIGCRVTVRREKMYHFLDKLINVVLPRVRDFRGVSPTAFDGRGNYSLGLKEQLIFPEIDYDKVDKINGLNITIVTSAKMDEEARYLLRQMGMPFRD